MRTYVVLLRGINVGKSVRVSMGDLRSMLGDAGFDVRGTVVQSGNVVLRSELASASAVRDAVASPLERRYHHRIGVVVRTDAQWRKLMQQRPFPESDDDARLVVHFSDPAISKSRLTSVDLAKHGPDRVAWAGEVFQWCPDGISNSPSLSPHLERALDCVVTARNWRTVTKLAELAES